MKEAERSELSINQYFKLHSHHLDALNIIPT